jgi:hypothetical protein
MDDRQLRIGQRAPVQVSSVPVDFTVTKGGVAVETEGFVLVVNSGGLSFVKGYLELIDPPATGAWEVTVPYLESTPAQVFGTIGWSGSANTNAPAKIAAGVITSTATAPASVPGDVLTIQGVL